jgi:hypothetical protein
VSVWINKGHVPEDGGKPWKHGTPHCRLLNERDRLGYLKQRVRNVDNKKPLEEHKRRRCPEPGCFGSREELRGKLLPEPSWLARARQLEERKPADSYWVYLLFDPALKQFQVGKAKNLYSRLNSRWKATLHGGFGTPDVIPWLHDRLVEDSSYEPQTEFVNCPTSYAALTAERAKRRELRKAGWYDSRQGAQAGDLPTTPREKSRPCSPRRARRLATALGSPDSNRAPLIPAFRMTQ